MIVGGWQQFAMWWTYTFWWAGELVSTLSSLNKVLYTDHLQATIFMCALVAFSFYWVRKKHYETFLVSHVVLSILVLLTMLMYVAGSFQELVRRANV